MVVVIVMMIMMMVVVVVVVMMMVVVVILGHYNRIFFSDSSVTAVALSAQNLLGIGNGIQQLGK